MVTISKAAAASESPCSRLRRLLVMVATVSMLFVLIILFPEYFADENEASTATLIRQQNQQLPLNTTTTSEDIMESNNKQIDEVSVSSWPSSRYTCPYMKLSDLVASEQFPQASSTRHIVHPPVDTRISLVCCETTAGPWSILVHDSWAPRGASRFLKMVRASHFSAPKVPLMRCVSNFLCQFGLNGASGRRFETTIPDDVQWLPAGPSHRVNSAGVKRYMRGYLSYAGGGNHSRSNQLFVALADNGMLGGGSPWEVPWGELVGTHSFDTLDELYTGYGEHGPRQGMLHGDNAIRTTEVEFPKISWILGCKVVDEG
ncbi:hypothetical protein MPSEU_001104700 [Mayamaea pseudoterrestris]|nr:hypothetical protein MPSEU_001104700 [Mayamaea pseudoterrestris]